MPGDQLLDCDVVMKGGITSGVVYPKALLRLKDSYRFRNIGGASAGAIAAGIAAAAELGRHSESGGFQHVEKLPGDMANHLSDLFQPTPRLAALHGVFVAMTTRNRSAIVWAVLRGYWTWLIAAALIGVISGWLAVLLGQAGPQVTTALGVIAFLLSGIVLMIVALLLEVFRGLPANDFGLCPGPTQGTPDFPGLSDWIAVVIEEAAGRPFPRDDKGRPVLDDPSLANRTPVTFGELTAAGINLKMMTTNLTLGLGHVLPLLDDANYWWKVDEMEKVLPKWIVAYLVAAVDPPREGSVLRTFPSPDKLPVAMGIRMSLSFPGLISAVRLHRIDFASAPDKSVARPQMMFFSDGGISSNFPIHFFDRLFPGRPTFGISLDDFDAANGWRVRLPMKAAAGRWFPLANRVGSLASFGMAILNTAKDWQDRRLGALSGYRERIAHIYLDPKEGGLNLKMPSEIIDALGDYGARAGALILGSPLNDDADPFDFADHRWRRFLIAYAQVEQLLEEMRAGWGDPGDAKSFAAQIQATLPHPKSYSGSSTEWRNKVWTQMNDLMTSPTIFPEALRKEKDAIPAHDARMRIVPEA